MVFAGYALFIDPPQEGCRAPQFTRSPRFGVEVKILTGDNERVARHICTAIGIRRCRRSDRTQTSCQ